MRTAQQAQRELVELRSSQPWAWAMGHGCTMPDHPTLRAIRAHEADLLAVILEHQDSPPPRR